jgi:poly(A) polymerase
VARAGLDQLSRERVRMELMKLLLAPRAVAALVVMAEAGLIGMVLGGVPHLASFANMVKVEAASGLAGEATRRLGALGVWIAEDAERLWQRLRLSNAEHARLAAMADRWWQVSPQIGEARARELIYRDGAEHVRDRVLLAWSRAQASAHDTAWRDLATLPQRWSAPQFPLRASHFIARGVEKGPSLGAALARAEAAWIAAGFPLERKALNEIVNEALGG